MPEADLALLLETIEPRGDWPERIRNASQQQLARYLTDALDVDGRRRLTDAFFDQTLPRRVLRNLLQLNDRHGELFVHMHRQMLARYDAELASSELPRVRAFGQDHWDKPIPEGYDPEGLKNGRLAFTTRQVDRQISDQRPAPEQLSHLELLQA